MRKTLSVVGLCALTAGMLLLMAGERRARAVGSVVFPKDAGTVNVRDYGTKGDGVTDDTAALQQALAAFASANKIVYLPNGTYLVSDTLRWPHGSRGGLEEKRTILQGQSRSGVLLKLKDACPGYSDPAARKAVINTGKSPAQRFRNAIRNLTVDTGKNNPGAAGIQYIANNQGCLRDVTIRSGDGKGAIGLDLAYTDEIGPCLIQNVTVFGFDIGIQTATAVDSETMEHITLEHQNVCGFVNAGQCVSLRDLHSDNVVPALRNEAGSGLVTLIDATLAAPLTGKGDAPDAAIINAAALVARNVSTRGYRRAIDNRAGTKQSPADTTVAEFVSHPILSLFPSPPHGLNLPIQETPDVPWDDLSDWVSPTQFGALPNQRVDATEAIQKAIDAGKTTVYFPNGNYTIDGTVIVRGNVRRLIGCEASIRGQGTFQFADGTAPVVVIERLDGLGGALEHASKRTLVIRSCVLPTYTNTGSGDLYLEDVVGGPFVFRHQRVWARQLNQESPTTKLSNDGGVLWVLGLKTERGGTLVETKGGGKTEICGGFCYATSGPKTAPMFTNDNSSVSLTIGESCFNENPFTTLLRETRGGVTRTLNRGAAPDRTNGSLLALYVGYVAGASP